MKRNFTLVFSLLAVLTLTSVQAATSISGYFDMEMFKKKDKAPTYRQHHMNLMMQHEVDIYKFFTEVEFEDATDMNWGNKQSQSPSTGYAKGDFAKGSVQGRLFVERAWAEANFSKYFSLRMGQMLHGSLFYQNHYPSIALYTGKQFTRKTIFGRNILGLRITGNLGMGISYQLWNGKDNNAVTNEGNGAKLAWAGMLGQASVSTGVQMAKYNGTANAVDQDALGFEASVDAMGFGLWFEYGTRKMNNDTVKFSTARAAEAKTMDILLSYTMDMEEMGEFVPFFMYSTHEGTGFQKGDVTADSYYTDKKEMIFGVNYRPLPTITWKLQYKNQPKTTSYDNTDTLNKGAVDSNEVALAFVYFYN